MNSKDFFSNLIDYSKEDGFSIFVPGAPFEEPEKLSKGKQLVVTGAASLAFGIIGGMSSGYLDKTNKDELAADLSRMKEHCDFASIKLSAGLGAVVLRLGIDGDDISDEVLIGRFSLIHARAHDFRKYAITTMRSIFGESKASTFAQVVLVFSMHKRAKEFNQNVAEQCKHRTIWKSVFTQPWVFDLDDQEISLHRHGIYDPLARRDTAKLKARLFRERHQ